MEIVTLTAGRDSLRAGARLLAAWLFLALVIGPAYAQRPDPEAKDELAEEVPEEAAEAAKEAEKEDKEQNWGGTPYFFTGPDTGFGLGFAILYRNMFGKEGRDTTFSFSYTETLYQYYDLTWEEPYFLSDQGRLKLKFHYENKPAIRYFGQGNDTELDRLCNYSWAMGSVAPTYIYRFPRTDYGIFGVRGGIEYKFADPEDARVDEPYEDDYNRPISDVYPELFHSKEFDHNDFWGPKITAYRDSRKDRFPLGGGREEIVWPLKGGYEEIEYKRYDEAFGSDYSLQTFSLDVRRYFPVISDDNIFVIRGKLLINQGNVPFYEMANYGGRGYYGNRYIDKCATEYNIEFRRGFYPGKSLPVFGGVIKLKYPSLNLFWDSFRVYEEYQDIPDEMFEGYHYAWGVAFRFVVTPSVVIRFEQGFSDEQDTFTMTAGLPF